MAGGAGVATEDDLPQHHGPLLRRLAGEQGGRGDGGALRAAGGEVPGGGGGPRPRHHGPGAAEHRAGDLGVSP